MPSLRETQVAFAAALLGAAEAPLLAGIADDGIAAADRLGIYRDNVRWSLARIVIGSFPATRRVAGEAAFTRLVGGFVPAHLPTAPQLLAWGGAFPDHLRDRADPWLADLAALEWARERACHAADATTLAADALAGIAPERLPELCLRLQPSLALLASPWPVWTLWQAATTGRDLPPIRRSAESVLVVRPQWQVLTLPTSPGEHTLLQDLAAGRTLGEAALAALDQEPGLDLQALLARHIHAGTFTGFT